MQAIQQSSMILKISGIVIVDVGGVIVELA